MSENEQGASLPACWNAAVFPQGESWAWVAWQDGNMFSRMQGGATNEALAWDGARKMIDERQKPPAPPDWMVEVATATQTAIDDDAAFQAAITALRLSLERGHVVEPRGAVASQPRAPEVDMEAALKRAWRSGWQVARNQAAEHLNKIQRDDLICSQHVYDIRCTLPTREA